MTDDELTALVSGPDRQHGIGGTTRTVEAAGAEVVVKLVPFTDRERVAGPQSTANLFGLPTWYQFGVGEGSAGFGAGRELAAHRLTTDWVRDGECAHFPLLHHARELPRPDDGGTDADLDRAVTFWGGSPVVESRLRELADARRVIALFLEHVPFVLRPWLVEQLETGAADAVIGVERQLFDAVRHLRSRGMVHFDAHFDNVLTDGETVYLSDFGLATSQSFDLDDAEREFLALTLDHDVAYCAAALVNLVVGTVIGFDGPGARNDYVRRCGVTGRAVGLTGVAAEVVLRHARTATIVNDFYWRLHDGEREADYPAAAIAAAVAPIVRG